MSAVRQRRSTTQARTPLQDMIYFSKYNHRRWRVKREINELNDQRRDEEEHYTKKNERARPSPCCRHCLPAHLGERHLDFAEALRDLPHDSHGRSGVGSVPKMHISEPCDVA